MLCLISSLKEMPLAPVYQVFSRDRRRFDPCILRHIGIWGSAEEAVLNTVHRKKSQKIFLFKFSAIFILFFNPFVLYAALTSGITPVQEPYLNPDLDPKHELGTGSVFPCHVIANRTYTLLQSKTTLYWFFAYQNFSRSVRENYMCKSRLPGPNTVQY